MYLDFLGGVPVKKTPCKSEQRVYFPNPGSRLPGYLFRTSENCESHSQAGLASYQQVCGTEKDKYIFARKKEMTQQSNSRGYYPWSIVFILRALGFSFFSLCCWLAHFHPRCLPPCHLGSLVGAPHHLLPIFPSLDCANVFFLPFLIILSFNSVFFLSRSFFSFRLSELFNTSVRCRWTRANNLDQLYN